MDYSKAVLACIPSGVKASKVYNIIGGDFTFSRSGGKATRRNKDGLIESVDSNVPRLDYEGAYPHLLLEPTRTNSQTYSEAFNSWTWSNTTVSSNVVLSPDGNKNADTLLETTTNGTHQITVGTFSGLSGTYTYSVFAKYNGRNLQIYSSNATTFACRVIFNLENGTIEQQTNGTGTIEDYGNGWYRCSVVGAIGSTSSFTVALRTANGTSTSFAGDTTKGVHLYGAQMENGTYATSYIPNLSTGSTSRTGETCLDATGEFNDSEGVLFAEIAPLADDGTYRVISISDGTANNRVSVYYTLASKTVTVAVFLSGSPVAAMSHDLDVNFYSFNKIAIKYKENDFAFWINGVEIGTDILGSVFPNGTLSYFDFSNGVTGNPFYGKVRQAIAFKEALTDAQLIELTK